MNNWLSSMGHHISRLVVLYVSFYVIIFILLSGDCFSNPILCDQGLTIAAKLLLDDLIESINKYKAKFSEDEKIPRPSHWSGWRLNPNEIEFWLDGKYRIHERLKYYKNKNLWEKVLLNP